MESINKKLDQIRGEIIGLARRAANTTEPVDPVTAKHLVDLLKLNEDCGEAGWQVVEKLEDLSK